MEFTRTIPEISVTHKQESIQKQAEKDIKLSDFCDVLYISFKGMPMVFIEPETPAKDIIERVQEIRKEYINFKEKEYADRSKS